MKQLGKSYWRLAWVLITNGSTISLFALGSVRAHHEQEMLNEFLRTTAAPSSYVGAFFSNTWSLIIVAILIAGIVAEIVRSTLSSILNVGPYALSLVLTSWQAAKVAAGKIPSDVSAGVIVMLMVIPLTLVVGVDLFFYVTAFRHQEAQRHQVALRHRS